jgi:peptidoglycan/xylan/chitin deacetylase (PgdA/CDA1 family)
MKQLGVLIFLYHRVFKPETDPQLLCVSPLHFSEHIEFLACHRLLLSVDQLADALEAGEAPERGVVVTFDDGYVDNLREALPILARHEAPAAFFVTAGYVGRGREFWWDELERILLWPGDLPEELRSSVGGKTRRWRLDSSARYGERDFENYKGWNVSCEEDPTPRHRAYRELCALLRPMEEGIRTNLLDSLCKQAGRERTAREGYRPLSSLELAELAGSELNLVGSHSMTHPVFSSLGETACRRELQESKGRLEGILGRSVEGFAYPYGTKGDYTAGTVRRVREAGYRFACSNFEGAVGKGSDPFQLPRLLVRDGGGAEFEAVLRRWFLP